MEKKEKIEYWLDIADYDLETAKAMLTAGRYLYVVFMCQQALEKAIKALYIHRFDSEPPKSHNLAFIFNQCGVTAPAETMTLFTTLSAHYINNRYPEYKHKLSTLLDHANAQEHLTNTEKTYTWLKSQLT
jgi:HEPN domain-containing protein